MSQRLDASAILDHSIRMGNSVDELYVELSKRAGYPFYAESEDEWDAFRKVDESPFLGYPKAVEGAIFRYLQGSIFNRNMLKVKWLLDTVRNRASKGDYECQGILMSVHAHKDAAFSFAYRQMYRESLERAVRNGDPDALYAKALFLTRYDSFERFALLIRSGEGGNGDAYYEAMNALRSVSYSHSNTFPDYDELIVYVSLAARARYGVFKPRAQYNLASAYADGEGDLVSSSKDAMHWYEIAARAGDTLAQSILETLRSGKLSIIEGRTKGIPQLTPEIAAARFALTPRHCEG